MIGTALFWSLRMAVSAWASGVSIPTKMLVNCASRISFRSSACLATLNIAKQAELLKLMREAQFTSIFVGIETPEAHALTAMRKDQNNAVPIIDSIRTLNGYGLEVTSSIILGLDTDSDD